MRAKISMCVGVSSLNRPAETWHATDACGKSDVEFGAIIELPEEFTDTSGFTLEGRATKETLGTSYRSFARAV